MQAAARLEPTNKLFRLKLFVLRLGSTNYNTAAAARAALEQFLSDTNFAPFALRALVTDRINRNDLSSVQNYATQLLATVQVTLGDRLQYLGILRQRHSLALSGKLKSIQRQSQTNALMAAAVAQWMMANGFQADTVRWLTSLPAGLQTQLPVQMALANSYLADNDWLCLRSFTSRNNWSQMDFLRSAFLSHVWYELGETLVADGEWHAAVGNAGEQFGALTALLDLAGR